MDDERERGSSDGHLPLIYDNTYVLDPSPDIRYYHNVDQIQELAENVNTYYESVDQIQPSPDNVNTYYESVDQIQPSPDNVNTYYESVDQIQPSPDNVNTYYESVDQIQPSPDNVNTYYESVDQIQPSPDNVNTYYESVDQIQPSQPVPWRRNFDYCVGFDGTPLDGTGNQLGSVEQDLPSSYSWQRMEFHNDVDMRIFPSAINGNIVPEPASESRNNLQTRSSRHMQNPDIGRSRENESWCNRMQRHREGYGPKPRLTDGEFSVTDRAKNAPSKDEGHLRVDRRSSYDESHRRTDYYSKDERRTERKSSRKNSSDDLPRPREQYRDREGHRSDRRLESERLNDDHHHHRRRGTDYDDRHRSSRSRHRRRSQEDGGKYRSRSRPRSRSRSGSRSKRSKHSHRRRDRSGSRSKHGDDSDYERVSYKKQEPQDTIMLRGLALHLTENDIMQDIFDCGVVAKDIRVIKNRDTGVSRGFAFVEFHSISDATTWIEKRKGAFTVEGLSANMIYTSNSTSFNEKGLRINSSDWFCPNCQSHNFKRRDFCYKCRGSRPYEEISDGTETSSQPTTTVVLGNLDGLTVEEGVLLAFQARPGLASIPIRNVRIGRDKVNNLSLGVCNVEFNNLSEAVKFYSALKEYPINIDNREVCVAYGRSQIHGAWEAGTGVAHHAVEAGQWTMDGSGINAEPYTQEWVEQMSKVSASHYAKTPEEYEQYYQFYVNYYKQQQTNADKNTEQKFASDIQSHNSNTPNNRRRHDLMVSGLDHAESEPWISQEGGGPDQQASSSRSSYGVPQYYDYIPDEYLDPNEIGGQSQTESNVAFGSYAAAFGGGPSGSDMVSTSLEPYASDKTDKLSEAKRIKKEMEKWEKSFRRRPTKISTPESITATVNTNSDGPQLRVAKPTTPIVNEKMGEKYVPSMPLISDSEEEDDASYDQQFMDVSKLACLLCKRQFTTPIQLQRHIQLSDLHKQNLVAIKGSGAELSYRDRAHERRRRFGLDRLEPKSQIQDLYLQSKKEQDEAPQTSDLRVPEDNIGNKLLQKMGWNAGQGLGARNQGRTDIIVAERRAANVGLGLNAVVPDGDGRSYANARELTKARYQQLE